MSLLPLGASFTIGIVIAMLSGPIPAFAQFVVDVRDASSGAGVDAKVQVKSIEGNKYLGRTKGGQPLQSSEKCDGRLLSAAPVFPMYEAQDEDERWKPCSNRVTIYLKPLLIVSGGFQLPSAEQARVQFAAYPTLTPKISALETGAESGQLAQISTSAKEVAEELERAGLVTEAEKYWTLSAQSALLVIARDQHVKYDGKGLVSKGDRTVFTPEAKQLIRDYQQANGLPNVGMLGPLTFETLAREKSQGQ